ncbi:MAG: dihydroneopterin aldolase [Hyphomonadaceae bacterium]
MALTIRIERAHTTAHVGVSAEERARAQALIVTVTLAMDAPGDFTAHDTISETLDYDRVLDFLRHGLDEEAKLIETVADRIAQHCLALSPRVQSVSVIVEKPSVLQGQGHVCVELQRAR